MNRILYENRCKCNKEFTTTKKRPVKVRSEGKPIQYPKSSEIFSKTFQIKYEHPLSVTAKLILNNFHNKYIYYAIDDILYSFQENPMERDNLLAILYSPILSLQNNFSVNFFDIWIREVYIEKISKSNKFLKTNLKTFDDSSYLTITFFYKTKLPVKKQKLLW